MTLFLIPILIGAFGWLLIWALVKLIFYPIQPIVFGPFRWESWASQWMQKIEVTTILPTLSKQDQFEALKPIIHEKLDLFFKEKLSAKMPMISMFIGAKTIEELKGVFMEELALIFPELITQFSGNLKHTLLQQWQMHLHSMLVQKVTEATIPFRWVAFGVGVVWGLVLILVLPSI
jgi:hypothetical protein